MGAGYSYGPFSLSIKFFLLYSVALRLDTWTLGTSVSRCQTDDFIIRRPAFLPKCTVRRNLWYSHSCSGLPWLVSAQHMYFLSFVSLCLKWVSRRQQVVDQGFYMYLAWQILHCNWCVWTIWLWQNWAWVCHLAVCFFCVSFTLCSLFHCWFLVMLFYGCWALCHPPLTYHSPSLVAISFHIQSKDFQFYLSFISHHAFYL